MIKQKWIKRIKNPTHSGAETTWSLIGACGAMIADIFNGQAFTWQTYVKTGSHIIIGSNGQADNLLEAMIAAVQDADIRGRLTKDEVRDLLTEAAYINTRPQMTEDKKRNKKVRKLAIKKLKAINNELDLLMEVVDEPSIVNACAEIAEAIFQVRTNPDYE